MSLPNWFKIVYGILAVPFVFVMVNVIPKSPCWFPCVKDNGQAIIDYFVNFFTGNGLIPQWVWLVAFPAWIVTFILIKVVPPLFRRQTMLKFWLVVNFSLAVYNMTRALSQTTLGEKLWLGGFAVLGFAVSGLLLSIIIVTRKPRR